MNYRIRMQVHTKVGSFEGLLSKETSPDKEALQELANRMQARGLTKLVLHSQGPSGEPQEIWFSESMLQDCVMVFQMETVDAPVKAED